MTDTPHNVLFLCTANSARSILAEALLNHLGKDRFRGYSAGSHPSGKVHPMAIETLNALGLATNGLRSKGWEEFAAPGAPAMAFVFTVCDNAAGEACPIWPGHPITAHWGVPDPAAVADPGERKRAFRDAASTLRRRIELLLSLPIEKLERDRVQDRVRDFGSR